MERLGSFGVCNACEQIRILLDGHDGLCIKCYDYFNNLESDTDELPDWD